ncbi:uncharacterized protein LOC129926380 isoform X2 [Biomphalaria glabrata]|uniref:Uncharacterized protein LOC129926380 isoform X2 n=1 Tax=Biomphalaria glabrata TaxID=6526 RepID=A0A9W3AFE1_BIOGL|nr:uncharacterized protein LOC129926380 isoform X2 [Biomphalaria glabrata]
MPWITAFFLVGFVRVIESQEKCNSGWFGERCQFQCHCSSCDPTGDLISSIATPNASVVSYSPWLDGDDLTCYVNEAIKNVVVTLWKQVNFQWIRLAVSDPNVVDKFNLHFEKVDILNKRYECSRQRFHLLNSRVVEIRCDMDELFDRIVLEGEGVTSLCSINVNGGRNVAMKQPTEQTSTNGTNVASNAVDGNSDSNFNHGSCTLTNNETDTSPTWTLTFDEPMIVNSFEIITREDDPWRKYVYKSAIQFFDTNNDNVLNYTYLIYWYPWYQFIVNFNKVALKKLSITAPKESFPTAILTFCEINIFGDCQPGYWDLDCKKTCDTRCPTSCSVVDGSCTTRCLGYTDAPLCTKECPPNKWGVNCRENCSDRCANRFCNNLDGSCTSGCNGYSDPPYCTQACTNGRYGLNCASPCIETCPDCESCMEEDNKLKGTYFGIGFGVCAVCILVILIFGVIYIKVIHRRYNICKQCVIWCTGDHDGVEVKPTDAEPINGSANVDIGSLSTDRTTTTNISTSASGRSIIDGYDVLQGGVNSDPYDMYRPCPPIQRST